MAELFTDLFDPEFPFLRYALLAGLLGSCAFGVIGSYVVARRISYMAAAISHSMLGGLGLALLLNERLGLTVLTPMAGATLWALAAALAIGLVSLKARQSEDAAIGVVWAVSMALGLLFIYKTPGYIDPMSYFWGDIFLLSKKDLWLIAGLDVVVVGLGAYYYHNLQAVCFDEEFARARGVNVDFHFLLLLCLAALSVALLVNIVGIIMIIALFTLPAATASHFSRQLWQMMLLAVVFCMIFTTAGIVCSYYYDLPGGPAIICVAGLIYLLTLVFDRLRKWQSVA